MKRKIPNVIIEVEGGNVIGICTDRSIRCVVVDHDTEGTDASTTKQYPMAKGQTEDVDATDWGKVARVPGFVKAALKTLGM